ncbi:MAG: trigger factor [Lachnospiraceae bacterium]|nr:trigger factor [Lachnospiraceae bacterium]
MLNYTYKMEKMARDRIKVEVTAPAAELGSAADAIFRDRRKEFVSPDIKRKVVTREMVESIYGADMFTGDAANKLISEILADITKKEELTLVENPNLLDIFAKNGEDFSFKAMLPIVPDPELGQYKGIHLAKPEPITISESDLVSVIASLCEESAYLEDVNRPAREADVVIMDYEGTLNGLGFKDGSAENAELTLGSHTFIPGFEEALIGHSAGDVFDIKVPFPEDYTVKHLAGKEATFHIVIHGVKARYLPKFDDKLVKEKTGLNSTAEYLDHIKASIYAQKEDAAYEKMKDEAIEAVLQNSKVWVSDKMVDIRVKDMVKQFSDQLQSQNLELEKYLSYMGTNQEEMEKEFRGKAKKSLEYEVLLNAIVKAENITVSDEEIREALKALAAAYGISVVEIRNMFSGSPSDYLAPDIKKDKAMALIMANAIVG